jgi:hypothetical protein
MGLKILPPVKAVAACIIRASESGGTISMPLYLCSTRQDGQLECCPGGALDSCDNGNHLQAVVRELYEEFFPSLHHSLAVVGLLNLHGICFVQIPGRDYSIALFLFEATNGAISLLDKFSGSAEVTSIEWRPFGDFAETREPQQKHLIPAIREMLKGTPKFAGLFVTEML